MPFTFQENILRRVGLVGRMVGLVWRSCFPRSGGGEIDAFLARFPNEDIGTASQRSICIRTGW